MLTSIIRSSSWLWLVLAISCDEGGGVAPIVQPPESPRDTLPVQGILFRSDWSAATGSGAAAVTDGSKWDATICPNSVLQQVLAVVPGSQAGWTATPNVMQVTNRGQSACGQVEERTSVPQGQDFYIRMYIRVEDENQPNFHPVDLNCCGAIQAPLWAIFDPVAGVDYNAKFTFETPSGSQYRRWQPQQKLRQREWYRFEWHVQFVDAAAGTARIWPRIYDMNNTLLYDARTHVGIDQRAITLQQFYDQGGVARFSNLDLARRYAVGYEGTGGARDTGRKWYYAAVEIRSDTWPGPVR